MKIKIKVLTPECKPQIISKGDWIDLAAAEEHKFNGPVVEDGKVKYDFQMIGLGVAMKLPKGFEAVIKGRSSLTKKANLEMTCSGLIDYSYHGDNDQWMFYCRAVAPVVIAKGQRICQFRIQLSQKATIWQKIKWLFSNKIEFEVVDHIGDTDRNGFGSTGEKEFK